MENTMTIQTPNQLVPSSVRPASGFGMPNGGLSCFGILADTRATELPATGLFISMDAAGSESRDRKDQVVKGHVALAAYVPGYLAWSPPIC